MPDNLPADFIRHATAIAAELPVPPGYPREGRAWASKQLVNLIRRGHLPGWPLETVAAEIPHGTSDGRPAVQPIAVVPRAWLEALAERCGCDLADACRGLIPDDE